MKPKILWAGALVGIMGFCLSACASDDVEAAEALVEVFNQEARDRDLGIHYWVGGVYSVIDGQTADPSPDMPATIFVESDLKESDMAELSEALNLLEGQEQRTLAEGLQFGLYVVTAMVNGTQVGISSGTDTETDLKVASQLLKKDIQHVSTDTNGSWVVDTAPCDVNDITCLEMRTDDVATSVDQIAARPVTITVPDHEGQRWMELRVVPDTENPLSKNRLEQAITLVKDINELGVKVSSLELGHQSQLYIHSPAGDEAILAAARQVGDRARELPEWQKWMHQKSLEGEVIYGPVIHARSEKGTPAAADLWISSSSITPPHNEWERNLKSQIEEILP